VHLTDFPEGILLVAAIIDQARLDLDNKTACIYAKGGHNLEDCSRRLLDNLEDYVEIESEVDATDVALEFIRIVNRV